jgi:hypothetical protein
VASGYVAHYVHLDDGDEVGVWVRVRYLVAAWVITNYQIRFTKKMVLTLSDNLFNLAIDFGV